MKSKDFCLLVAKWRGTTTFSFSDYKTIQDKHGSLINYNVFWYVHITDFKIIHLLHIPKTKYLCMMKHSFTWQVIWILTLIFAGLHRNLIQFRNFHCIIKNIESGISSLHCISLIHKPLIQQLYDDGYFQYYNANAQKAWEPINYASKFFGEEFISKELWSSTSPNLTWSNFCCVII